MNTIMDKLILEGRALTDLKAALDENKIRFAAHFPANSRTGNSAGEILEFLSPSVPGHETLEVHVHAGNDQSNPRLPAISREHPYGDNLEIYDGETGERLGVVHIQRGAGPGGSGRVAGLTDDQKETLRQAIISKQRPSLAPETPTVDQGPAPSPDDHESFPALGASVGGKKKGNKEKFDFGSLIILAAAPVHDLCRDQVLLAETAATALTKDIEAVSVDEEKGHEKFILPLIKTFAPLVLQAVSMLIPKKKDISDHDVDSFVETAVQNKDIWSAMMTTLDVAAAALPAVQGALNGTKSLNGAKSLSVPKSLNGWTADASILGQYDIKRVLVATYCPSSYECNNNLPGGNIDRENLKTVFSEHGYTVRGLDAEMITLEHFEEDIESVRDEMNVNADDYDAFIFAFSGHGDLDSIVLSDLKHFGRVDLFKYFNAENCPSFKLKPKVLLLDACKGHGSAQSVDVEDPISPNSVKAVGTAAPSRYPVHPDDKIVILESNSDNYVSYDLNGGGALMQSFVRVMRDNVGRLLLDDMLKLIDIGIERFRKHNQMQVLSSRTIGIREKVYFLKEQPSSVASKSMGGHLKVVDPVTIGAAIGMVDQGTTVADHVVDLLSKIRKECLSLQSDHAMIINQDPKERVVTFYVYNQVTPFAFNTQFRFASKRGALTDVYCTGFGGMKVFVNNESPGWGLQRGGVYVFDGEGITKVMDAAAILEKTQSLDQSHLNPNSKFSGGGSFHFNTKSVAPQCHPMMGMPPRSGINIYYGHRPQ